MNNGKLGVAIDFDGTICEHWFPDVGPPKPGVKEALKKLGDKGYYVIIHSVRVATYFGDCEYQYDIIKKYMRSYGLAYDEIWTGDKPLAVAYIDDRGIAFKDNWSDMVAEVDKLAVRALQSR